MEAEVHQRVGSVGSEDVKGEGGGDSALFAVPNLDRGGIEGTA